MTNYNRKPAGQPTGGEFTKKAHAGASVGLEDPNPGAPTTERIRSIAVSGRERHVANWKSSASDLVPYLEQLEVSHMELETCTAEDKWDSDVHLGGERVAVRRLGPDHWVVGDAVRSGGVTDLEVAQIIRRSAVASRMARMTGELSSHEGSFRVRSHSAGTDHEYSMETSPNPADCLVGVEQSELSGAGPVSARIASDGTVVDFKRDVHVGSNLFDDYSRSAATYTGSRYAKKAADYFRARKRARHPDLYTDDDVKKLLSSMSAMVREAEGHFPEPRTREQETRD